MYFSELNIQDWLYEDLAFINSSNEPFLRVYYSPSSNKRLCGFDFIALISESSFDLLDEIEIVMRGNAYWDGINLIEFGDYDEINTKDAVNKELNGYINDVHINQLLQIMLFLRELENRYCEHYTPDYSTKYTLPKLPDLYYNESA